MQSLRRIDLGALDPAAYDVVIVDEFHHAEAPTYRRLLEHLRPRLLLGLTATPERADGLDVTRWFDTGNDARMNTIIRAVGDLVQDPRRMRALAFCVSVEHARYVAGRFVAAGIAAEAVSGDTAPEERDAALARLRTGETNALCSVDLFNEGLDVPEVDTVLLLRPTESATVFLQQLGRGLRPAPRKAGLTGARRRDLLRQVEDGFPFLPAGCSILLDRVAQEVVVANVRHALLAQRRAVLADELRALGDVSLATFLAAGPGHALDEVYRGDGGGPALRRRAGLPAPAGPDEVRLSRAIGRLRHVDDEERVAFYTRLLAAPAPPATGALSPRQRRLVTMLHFGLWGPDRRLNSLEASLARFWEHPALRDELAQLLGVLGELATHRRADARLGPDEPLWAHVRYTRLEALAALGDYAVAPDLFPGVAVDHVRHLPDRPASPSGTAGRGGRVCLFAREAAEDEAGGTVAFLFLGRATYLEHRGERPMAVTRRVDPPLPAAYFQAARAVA